MAKLKETVKTKDVDDNELILDVKHPSGQQLADSQIIYSSEWQKAFNKGCIVADQLDEQLRKMGVWDESKTQERNDLRDSIEEGQKKIKSGGIKLKDAKDLALSILDNKNKLRTLLTRRNRLESNTAEAYANNAQFNYLVSVCVVYNKDGKRYFKSYEDYLERMEEQAAIDTATKLFAMINDPNQAEDTPEVKFLKKFHIINDKGFLLNKDGQAVDDEGRLVDDEGRYIDGKGGFVDKLGNPVDEKGEPIIEFSPFLDDEGRPILEDIN